MPLNVNLSPYTLESVISNDRFIAHYAASNEDQARFIITEFYPAYMTTRSDDGSLEISSRFADEYAKALGNFIKMADTLQYLNDIRTPRIDEVIQQNNTAYIVRQVSDYMPLGNYLGNKRMPFNEAYIFVKPMFASLAQAEKAGLLFAFDFKDMRVNQYTQLTMDCMFMWEADFRLSILKSVSLFYHLVTGQPYEPLRAAPETLGVKLPTRLNELITDVLINGDILYGSYNDFNTRLRFIMGLEGDRSLREKKSPIGNTALMKWLAVFLAALVMFAIVFLLILNVIIPVYQIVNPTPPSMTLAESDAFTQNVPKGMVDFFGYAVTAPSDRNNILNGAFFIEDGVLYRRSWQNGYGLTRVDRDGTETHLLHEVRPTFLSVHEGFIYFSDGLANYQVFRVGTNGNHTEIITPNGAAYLQLIGDYLYYTNMNDLNRLYRLDLRTKEDLPYIQTAVLETVYGDHKLYYLDGNQDFHLYATALAEEASPVLLAAISAENLRYHEGRLYYIDSADASIQAITTEGEPVDLNCPIKARSFEIDGSWLVAVTEDGWRLVAYHLQTGEQKNLSTARTAHVWANRGAVYAIDYEDSRVVREFALPEE